MELSRRNLLRVSAYLGTAVALGGLTAPQAARAADPSAQPSIDEALQMLLAGNQRFVSQLSVYPNQTLDRRNDVAPHQNPWAALLSCIDSRVPPELVFDQGLGDLFVARVAGNVNDDLLQGSLEFAVAQYGVPLVVVLGHQRCGAVEAAVDLVTKGIRPPGEIGGLADAIAPAVRMVQGQPGDLTENAARANIRMVTQQLRSAEPIIAKAVREGAAGVVGLYYSVDTGAVEVVDPGTGG
jgi:carbonic anhydrase